MSKKKHKKGLLPAGAARTATSNAEGLSSKQTPQPGHAQSTKAGEAKSSTSVAPAINKKTAPAKPQNLDPVTGKKKGTLFSAAPAAPLKTFGRRQPRQPGATKQAPSTAHKSGKHPGASSDGLHGHSGAARRPAAGAEGGKRHKRKRSSNGQLVCSSICGM